MKKYTICSVLLLVMLCVGAAVFWGARIERERNERIQMMVRAIHSNESREAITSWINSNLSQARRVEGGHSIRSITVNQPFIWTALGVNEEMINSSVYAEVGSDGNWVRILFDASRTGIIATRDGWGDYEPYIISKSDGFAVYARND